MNSWQSISNNITILVNCSSEVGNVKTGINVHFLWFCPCSAYVLIKNVSKNIHWNILTVISVPNSTFYSSNLYLKCKCSKVRWWASLGCLCRGTRRLLVCRCLKPNTTTLKITISRMPGYEDPAGGFKEHKTKEHLRVKPWMLTRTTGIKLIANFLLTLKRA